MKKIAGLRRKDKIVLVTNTTKRFRTWSDENLKFLIDNFHLLGPSKCSRILNKKKVTVQAAARKLGLRTNVSCGRPRKKAITIINDKRTIMICKHHGRVEFYTRPNRAGECLICRRKSQKRLHKSESYKIRRRKWTNARRRTPLGNYEHRLRGLLRHALKGKASYTKDLPYSSQDLCDHLEKIRLTQNNLCPMCHALYENVGYNIDHIIPVSSANNEGELLRLFDLDNLSLLCPECNQHIKRDKIGVVYG